ncbi:MAG: hypothetical protein HKN03_15315 [Acidimicrobiales bacterium]|nr:hypothetical protein [Acidimicrobiales bacterium]
MMLQLKRPSVSLIRDFFQTCYSIYSMVLPVRERAGMSPMAHPGSVAASDSLGEKDDQQNDQNRSENSSVKHVLSSFVSTPEHTAQFDVIDIPRSGTVKQLGGISRMISSELAMGNGSRRLPLRRLNRVTIRVTRSHENPHDRHGTIAC